MDTLLPFVAPIPEDGPMKLSNAGSNFKHYSKLWLLQIVMLIVILIISGCTGSKGRIVYDGQPDDKTPYEIYAVNVTTRHVSNLSDNPDWDDYYPDVSPDGKRIVFASNREGGLNDIYIMNSNGSHQSVLTDNGASLAPVWSPDGKKIAFLSGGSGSWDIYTMSADGSNKIRLTNQANNTYPLRPNDFTFAWSPDGTQIVFAPNDGSIRVIKIDGSGVTTLSNEHDLYPVWSPDGKKIAFSSDRTGDWGIYLINADGSGTVSLIPPVGAFYPIWSPDGKKLAFQSHQDIYVVNADGSALTNLTKSSARDEDPAWSPDGTRIAFKSGGKLYTMNIDGSDVVQMGNGESWYGFSIGWMP
jgi:TolB protein